MATAKTKGFTLTELLVVVAIIGILSSVAIPSFKKYVAKTKTTYAKLMLSEGWSAQQSAYAEFTTYVSCFVLFGVSCTTVEAVSGLLYCAQANNYYFADQSVGGGDGSATWGNQYVRAIGGLPNCNMAAAADKDTGTRIMGTKSIPNPFQVFGSASDSVAAHHAISSNSRWLNFPS